MNSAPPPYIMGSTLPPVYGSNAAYGIRVPVNELIMGATPLSHLGSCYKANRLTDKTKRYESKIKPLLATRGAIAQFFCPRSDGWPSYQLIRMLGLVSLPAAIVGDIVKPPYYLAQIAIASSRSKRARKEAENQIIDEVVASLYLSQKAVYEIVLRLGIETHETWNQQIREYGPFLFLTLARLLEAYGSRFAPPDTIYLASRKQLRKESCSGIARLHFDQIHNLKDDLILVNCLPQKNLTHASAEIEWWLPMVVQALKGSWMDKNENRSFYYVLQRLHNTRQELPGLL
jgi:hypothetical protein